MGGTADTVRALLEARLRSHRLHRQIQPIPATGHLYQGMVGGYRHEGLVGTDLALTGQHE